MTMNNDLKKYGLYLFALCCLPLTQCDTTQSDIEAINARNALIMQETKGNYYVGRRYHVPATRFWGYLRKPGETWRTAQLVLMDETKMRTPDRSPEYGPDKKYSKDNNYEYHIFGKYTGKYAYEPNSNLKLPVFQLTGYKLVNTNPGWLFKPSEKYSTEKVSLRPVIMP